MIFKNRTLKKLENVKNLEKSGKYVSQMMLEPLLNWIKSLKSIVLP